VSEVCISLKRKILFNEEAQVPEHDLLYNIWASLQTSIACHSGTCDDTQHYEGPPRYGVVLVKKAKTTVESIIDA
jgi:hypothetical protein